MNDISGDTLDLNYGGTGAQQGTRENIVKLKGLLRRRTRTWWNKAFLFKYIEKSLIPRGLRIQIFPSFPIMDETFKTKWEDLANTCSVGFLTLLRDLNETSLGVMESEIELIQTQLQKELDPAKLKQLNDEVDLECQRWVKEIHANKLQKLSRDINDKQTGSVYRWRSTNARSRSRSRKNHPSRSRSTSFASSLSTDEQSSAGNLDACHALDVPSMSQVQTRPTHKKKRTIPFQKENVTSTDLHCPFKGIEQSKLSVNREIVREYLANINEFKSPGPDELHPRVLKEIVEEILEPLSIIFENSWRTGEVPEDWRRANVVPIFKKGKKVDPGNYRPVSLTSIPGKIFEQIIKQHVCKYMDKNEVLNQSQHGKPTAVNSLIHATSAHDSSTIKAIPIGQFLRVRQICSTNFKFEKRASYLAERFRHRGYSNRGLTSRELRVRVHEHVRDIGAARVIPDPRELKTLPRHFKSAHNCDPRSLRVCCIDVVHLGSRGGNAKRLLAQKEARWITTLDTLSPRGLNEHLGFSSFL
ncbi:uncharacterized protein [Phyllobates terribilis]|uniref:uncharacterized protein n=1 Tax=Phyllobates terribilis TaxID=111132 RepID=UPI003CCAA454